MCTAAFQRRGTSTQVRPECLQRVKAGPLRTSPTPCEQQATAAYESVCALAFAEVRSGLERVMGIEPKTYPLNLLFEPMTCPQCATLRVTGV